MKKNVKKNEWVIVGDSKVRHIWSCSTCGQKQEVSPESYQEVGTPICDGGPNGDSCCEGKDMNYICTEILK